MATLKCRICNMPFNAQTVAEAYNKIAEHWGKEHGYIPKLAKAIVRANADYGEVKDG